MNDLSRMIRPTSLASLTTSPERRTGKLRELANEQRASADALLQSLEETVEVQLRDLEKQAQEFGEQLKFRVNEITQRVRDLVGGQS